MQHLKDLKRWVQVALAVFVLSVFLAVIPVQASPNMDQLIDPGDRSVTYDFYQIYTYREESMGVPPYGTEGMDGCHVVIRAEFPGALTLEDADAAAGSFVLDDQSSVQGWGGQHVTVEGNVLTLDSMVTYMPGGVISFSVSVIDGLTCDGAAVYWPEDFRTVVPTGLSFHVTDITVGTDTVPASTTIRIDKSSVVRSMNHILWTSNGTAIRGDADAVGTAQTSPVHHHNYWGFTLGESARFIKDGVGASLPGYHVSYGEDMVTITADTAREGEYLGIYDYDDDFLQQYGFTLSDRVTVLPMQEIQEKLDIAKRCTVTLPSSVDWTGSALTPKVTVVDGFYNGIYACELTENVDYTVSYTENVALGSTAQVTVTGIGSYEGSVVRTFRITAPLQEGMFQVDTADEVFKGSAYKKTVTSPAGLQENVDYTVRYQDNAFPGKASVIITGMGAYSGTLSYDFQILPAPLTKEQFTVDTSAKTYTGRALTPAVSSSLRKNAAYTVSYENNINAGKGKITVTGKGDHTDSLVYFFKISPAPLKASEFTVDTRPRAYTGKALTLNFRSPLKKGTDYKISYADNRNVGPARAILSGIGNYTGKIQYDFRIKLAQAKITRAAVGKGRVVLRWSKTGADRYIVYYREKGTSKWKKKAAKTDTVTLTRLKKEKKYQVKVVSIGKTGQTSSKIKVTGKIR